jgi:hypothetical protein
MCPARASHPFSPARPPVDQRARVRRAAASHVAPLAFILLGASVCVASSSASAAQGPVGLGRADSFAVLAGSGITNTGATTVTGDIGTFPTPSETGFGSITLSGTNHDGDAVTQGAKNDLVAAYGDAFGRTPVNNVAVELGGSTLLAGVYTSPTFGLTGTLTLDAKGNTGAEFIFQAGSTLITASDSRVLLVNGADPCHVVWQVGSSATFGTRTQFVGDVLVQTSITATTGAVFQGRLLARDGAVTLDHNTITRASCVVPAATPSTTSTTTRVTPTTIGTTATRGGAPTTTPGPANVPRLLPTGSPTAGVPGATPFGGPGVSPPAAVPALVTGTPAASPGPPPGVAGPPGVTSGPPSSPPSLAFTGLRIVGMVATALALLTFGLAGLAAGRRGRKARSTVGSP